MLAIFPATGLPKYALGKWSSEDIVNEPASAEIKTPAAVEPPWQAIDEWISADNDEPAFDWRVAAA